MFSGIIEEVGQMRVSSTRTGKIAGADCDARRRRELKTEIASQSAAFA